MGNNKNKFEVTNEKYEIAKQLVRLDGFLVTILVGFVIMIISQFIMGTFPSPFPILIGVITSICTLIFFYLFFQKRKIAKTWAGERFQKVDPVLLLAGYGIDIQQYSESLLENCSSLHMRLDAINQHIIDLNDKIHTTGEDIDRVYQIVSLLATEEVKLMEAVGKTSEEIDIMFDIVNVVIAEIQSRNETMENLVFLSKDGRIKVADTNKTIKKITESSGNILKLIDFINGVSKETNLLAINAAIEATHSGSESKGFTVIADEIGKLSSVTANNAKQITKILKENINDYDKAEKLGIESGNAFQFIADEIHIVHGTIAEVIQSIQELKSRGGAILSKGKTLDAVAERVRDTSGEVYGEIVTIHTSLEDIQGLSDTIQQECEEIHSAQREILLLTENLKGQLKNISNQTDEILSVV
ncbi:methyl-accepting chemotaxis protein (MCP) signaling protein [Leptospira meyeri]|uniref:Methyl-accepting chemotaxis protein (MCP) signaling protein n=1 Tax=Leptospira meyeri TaxID=29508 RepID=A0A4R8MSV0_LEPME|nr:methyl-accepting chemotaxis protein [Leptospira meyeri]EKJ86009.1 methyl-accepting chemotaxis protein signaling domain protein [Leptospira meyeri serovar Hardjo str. Went 5]TDY68380.1 methyl-accepting chemotaxis protein (MCP) signaling protein [Leptospira meyeri]